MLATDELSEEDQKLKDELDMLVERLQVRHVAASIHLKKRLLTMPSISSGVG